jgi:gliding motility-associated-like protein
MRMHFFKLLFTALFSVIILNLTAQVSIDQTLTPQQLVQDVLLGTGVTVTNVTFNGAPGTTPNTQIGRYLGPSSVVGFDDGIVMVSGNANTFVTGIDQAPFPNITGDPDLFALANIGGTNFTVNNCAILEFDFIPNGEVLEISFVFASREYPGFTCSTFNDPFGFFISGPGISGPFSNGAANIALIPNSNTPIGVNTINGGVPTGGGTVQNCLNANPNFVADSQYFVNNNPSPAGDVQFPGLTTTLTAFANVICGQEYHIKLAIADASDGILDAGVFIEAASFMSIPTVDITIQPTFNGSVIGENGFTEGIVEGCTEAEICFYRSNSDEDFYAWFTLGGTAIPGVDYPMPDTIIYMPAGVDSICFYLSAFADNIPEDNSFIEFTVYNISCGDDTLVTIASIQIFDEYEFVVIANDVTIFCPQDQVEISAFGAEGVWPYSYVWTESDMTTVIGNSTSVLVDVPASGSETYFVTVADACGINQEVGSVTVFNQIPPAPLVTTSPNDTINCVGQTSTLIANGTFGLPPLTYQWSTGQTSAQITVTPNGTVTENVYTVTVTDACGRIATAEVIVYFIPLEAPVADAGDDVTVLCAGDQVTLSGSAIGGALPYSYNWIGTGSSQNVNVSPDVTTTYQLQITDACGGISEIVSVQVIVPIYDPVVVSIPTATSLCPGDAQTLQASVSGGTGVYTYNWSTGSNNSSTVVSPESSNNYNVTVVDQCGVEAEGFVQVIVPVYAPITAGLRSTPVCTGQSITLQIFDIEGGAGNSPTDYTYNWIGEGSLQGEGLNGTVVVNNAVEGIYTVEITDVCGNYGEASVESLLAGIQAIPNVITPNNDGMNDRFEIPGSELFKTSIIIHDRWGKVVYENANYQNTWQGADKKGETYYYIVDISDGQCVYNGYVHVLDAN